MADQTHRSLLLVILLLPLWITACQKPVPTEPPPQVEAFLGEAEYKIYQRDLSGALADLDRAVEHYPRNEDVYLLRGSLLEALDRHSEAEENWELARQMLPPGSPGISRAAYRLLLLLALKMDRPQEAEALLKKFPEKSVYRRDAAGVLLLKQRKIRQALIAFNQALQMTNDRDLIAGILLHAAHAYHRLEDQEQTSKALYGAINLTRDPSLIKDIEALWRKTEGENR